MKSTFSSNSGSSRNMALNIITIGILLLALIGIIIIFSIFTNPRSSLNPLPPPPVPPTVQIPSPTATLRALPDVWTPTPWDIAGIGEPTQFVQNPNPLGTNLTEQTPQGGYPFALQGSPAPVASSTFRPSNSCSWLGVGGRVYDLANSPIKGMVLLLGGTINGVDLEEKISLSGMAPIYGPSGFEFMLSSTPLQTTHSYWIQLEDQAGNPVSDKIFFDTFADCKKNLILINFKQVH